MVTSGLSPADDYHWYNAVCATGQRQNEETTPVITSGIMPVCATGQRQNGETAPVITSGLRPDGD